MKKKKKYSTRLLIAARHSRKKNYVSIFTTKFSVYSFPIAPQKLLNMSQNQKVVAEVQEKVVAPVQAAPAPAAESKSKKSKSRNKKNKESSPPVAEVAQPIQKDDTMEDLSVRTDSGIVDPPSEPAAAATGSASSKKKSRSKKNKKSAASTATTVESEPAAESVVVAPQPQVVAAAPAPVESTSSKSKKKKSKNSESKSDEKVQNFLPKLLHKFFLLIFYRLFFAPHF